jgi:2-keto-4-pentenoate hydratase/2-oxohepta-3-ene-1,7-dioic acid hydratase in catechol pathway
MRGGSYRLASYADERDTPRAGVVVDTVIIDIARALAASGRVPEAVSLTSVRSVLERWRELHPVLQALAREVRDGDSVPAARALEGVRLLAPVLYPGTIFCAGANYKDHVAEMARALDLPEEPDPHERGLNPWHFLKASAPCVRGTGSRIALPAYSKRVDWEAEIALVIGRKCRGVPIDEALDHVAGLTVVNDLSARDHLKRDGVSPDSPFRFDWVSQKCFDGALPMGPWICPIDEIQDLDDVAIRLWLNDELMQDSSSSNLIFSMAEQISHLSSRLTLEPGDVIATGTPAGCGAARGRFLEPGDRVRVWVEGVGEILNEFTA